MTISNDDRDVLSKLSTKGRIGGRNPLRSLTSMVDLRPDEVRAAVDRLAESGKIDVSRHSDGRIREIIHPSPRRHFDRTEMSAQAKKERTFAKGVPAYLPDEMCSPVTVTQGEPRKKKSTTTENEEKMARSEGDFAYNSKAPYHKTLTMCLSLIRQHANDEGEGKGMTELLKTSGMSSNQVSKAMDHLRGMGLYTSWMSGFQVRSYLVDMEVPEVTEHMVAEYRQAVRDKAKQKLDEEIEIDIAAEVEAAIELVQGEEPEGLAGTDPIGALVEVVEELEAQVAELRSQLANVEGERDELRSEVGSLREKLDAHPLQDERVQKILRRHQR